MLRFVVPLPAWAFFPSRLNFGKGSFGARVEIFLESSCALCVKRRFVQSVRAWL